MIEVMTPNDIEEINVPEVQAYLYKRFKEIAYTLIPQIEGYFLYVEDFSLLYESHQLMHIILPSIEEALFDRLEGLSVEGDIVEVSLLFNNEFLISLVFKGLDQESLEVISGESKSEKSNT